MTTYVEDLRAELARAQAEGRELRAKLAIAEGERDEARADMKSERGFAEGRRQQRNEAAGLLARRLEADAQPLTWGSVAWDSQRPDALTLTLAAVDGSERRATIPREKVATILAAAELAGWKPTGKKVRRG